MLENTFKMVYHGPGSAQGSLRPGKQRNQPDSRFWVIEKHSQIPTLDSADCAPGANVGFTGNITDGSVRFFL